MPKRKPDQTVNVRLELQDYERRALASYATATAIKDVADAIDKLTSFENMYIIATFLEMATGKEILPGTPNDLYFILDSLREWLKKGDGTGSEILDFLGTWPTVFGGLVD
jgi:hypothetical protein